MTISKNAAHYIGKVEFELINMTDPLEKVRNIQIYRNDAHFELDEPELDRAKKYLEKREREILASLNPSGRAATR